MALTSRTSIRSLLPRQAGKWSLKEQGISQAPLTYNLTNGKENIPVKVSAEVRSNPVIPGFRADPEILFSRKTGRFYLYPTTDGTRGWGGHTFDVYSSPDLVNWDKENTILDLKTDDVKW